MWHLWLKSGNNWIEATQSWVEQSDAETAGKALKTMFSLDQVFVQYGADTDLIEVI